MPENRYVVLDKSFLRSVPKDVLVKLSSHYDFLASATLMGECFQTFLPSQKRDERTRRLNVGALMKFSDASCSLYSISSVEYLVGLEVSARRPCWPIDDYVRAKIQLNPTYFDEQYRMKDREAPVVEDWSAKVRESVEILIESYNQGELWPVIEWDDDLKKLSEQTEPTAVVSCGGSYISSDLMFEAFERKQSLTVALDNDEAGERG